MMCQFKIPHPAEIFLFKNKGKITTFINEGTLGEFMANRPALKEMLKEIISEGKLEGQECRKSNRCGKGLGEYNNFLLLISLK